MKYYIEVNNICLYGFYGCFEEELRIGGYYWVDVFVKIDFLEVVEKDDLDKMINYVIINWIVVEEMVVCLKFIEYFG